MAAKRKTDDVPGLTGREKKKQKTALARTIAVQPTTGSGTSTPSQNAQAGPSRAVHFDSMSLLYRRTVTILHHVKMHPPCPVHLTLRGSQR